MHVTKHIFDSTIGLLLDIVGKMKDGLNAHKDLQVLRIREELHPQERPNGKVYLPPASYTLTNEEKRAICKCLCEIRVPTGFSTNIKNLVSMSELKVSGYNTHDCHTMLSWFLPLQSEQSIRIKSMWAPPLFGGTVAPCVDSLQCYGSFRWPKSIPQDSSEV
jgi:hypothetical protein